MAAKVTERLWEIGDIVGARSVGGNPMIPGTRVLTWAIVAVIVAAVGLMYIAYYNSKGNDTSSAVSNTRTEVPPQSK